MPSKPPSQQVTIPEPQSVIIRRIAPGVYVCSLASSASALVDGGGWTGSNGEVRSDNTDVVFAYCSGGCHISKAQTPRRPKFPQVSFPIGIALHVGGGAKKGPERRTSCTMDHYRCIAAHETSEEVVGEN